jgi:hypothetical protein
LILATSKIEDFDRFWNTFSTKGGEKRKQHGSKGSHVFRDPNDDSRVWVVFDWDEEGFQNFLSDPDVPAIASSPSVLRSRSRSGNRRSPQIVVSCSHRLIGV